jgi:hypothetical protein
MPINPFNTGVRKSPATAYLPWRLTQFRNRVKATLPPIVQKWAAEQAQRIARERQGWAWQQARLRTETRARFQPLARAQGLDISVFEHAVLFEVTCNLCDQANYGSGIMAVIYNAEAQLASVGDDALLANADLQNTVQNYTAAVQVVSDSSKMLYDAAMAVIGNMKS